MNVGASLLIAASSYLLGSIPAGFIAGKIAGVDVRQHGSGNIGATNVVRVLGKKFGYTVFVFDVIKGLLAVRLAYFIARPTPHPEYYAIGAAVCAIIGHTFPVWLRFRGGKGVATSVGALFGLVPLAAVIILLIWYLSFEITRYVSLASMIAAGALPAVIACLISFGFASGIALLYFGVVIAGLVLWRHRTNIGRLVAGTEPRFQRR